MAVTKFRCAIVNLLQVLEFCLVLSSFYSSFKDGNGENLQELLKKQILTTPIATAINNKIDVFN